MGLKREEREVLKKFIIDNVDNMPKQIAVQTAKKFGISRQAVHGHISGLIKRGVLESVGKGNTIQYFLKKQIKKIPLDLTQHIEEHTVWLKQVFPFLPQLPSNIVEICNYGVCEMLNNVIDHSESKTAYIQISISVKSITFCVVDQGVGIFNKIQKHLNLSTPQHAILELAKGKFTSDPDRHSGEGIFFTSRMFDEFYIWSEKLCFYGHIDDDWIFDSGHEEKGTFVLMRIKRDNKNSIKEVFDTYTLDEIEGGFSKTIVPVRLLQHEGEELVSRSQAKRLIVRFDRFKEVLLDFNGVKIIGQAFADEIFRVFKKTHPQVHLTPIGTNEAIKQMIGHVLNS
ncbi:MAG: DUF4325 domain-containing protein [Candidatus Omnitrophota bacterium]